MNPQSLRFAKTHEWVQLDGDFATVGISDFAVAELTDIVHLELPAVGRKIKRGEEVGEIESVKAVSDIYAPVDGEIIAVNDGLPDDLSALSDDAYGKGWMFKVRLTDPGQVNSLMDHAAYQQECGSH